MLPKPLYTKLKAHVLKMTKEQANETKGKTGLAAVPFEVGRGLSSWLVENHAPRHEIEPALEYLVKQNLLARHPWGGYMLPQPNDAPAIPPIEDAKTLVKNAVNGLEKLREQDE